MSASGDTFQNIVSKPKSIETKMSPEDLLSTIERIEKLIDEVPEEFILDVQTALNKVFVHRLAAGAVFYSLSCHVKIVDIFDVVVTLQWLHSHLRTRFPKTMSNLNR